MYVQQPKGCINMANDIYFRTSLTGYNKSDVINFIEKLNSEQVERVNELNERLRSSQSEVKRMDSELVELRKKCSEMERLLTQKDADRITNEEKAQKYDAMQGTYADIMLEAEHTSKEKVRLAEEKAEKILEDANEAKKLIVAENKQIIESSKAEFIALIDKLTLSMDATLNKIGNENE